MTKELDELPKKKPVTVAIQCPPGVVAVGDRFKRGETYRVSSEEAEKFIKAGKMIPAVEG